MNNNKHGNYQIHFLHENPNKEVYRDVVHCILLVTNLNTARIMEMADGCELGRDCVIDLDNESSLGSTGSLTPNRHNRIYVHLYVRVLPEIKCFLY